MKEEYIYFLLTVLLFIIWFNIYGFPFGQDGQSYIERVNLNDVLFYNFWIVNILKINPEIVSCFYFPFIFWFLFIPNFKELTNRTTKEIIFGTPILMPFIFIGLWNQFTFFTIWIIALNLFKKNYNKAISTIVYIFSFSSHFILKTVLLSLLKVNR